jgi:DNA adenine methylase
MKTPITYYGGKQLLSKRIIALIPKHTLYCEPFFGGGAVFFAKEPSPLEVINDINGELINLYRVIKTQFKPLQRKIQSTLHSRLEYKHAQVIFTCPELFNSIDRAWSVWVLTNQTYASKLNGSWGYDKKENKSSKQLHYKRESFTEEIKIRLGLTQIECADALEVIRKRDSKTTFFYVDPPYFNSALGPFKNYNIQDFENLLLVLSKIKGKFILSSYPSKLQATYAKKNKWHTKRITISVSISSNLLVKRKKKVEVLTGNFIIS